VPILSRAHLCTSMSYSKIGGTQKRRKKALNEEEINGEELLSLEDVEHRRRTMYCSALVVNRVGASPDPPLAHPVGVEHRGRPGRLLRGVEARGGIAALGKILPPWSLCLPRR
jgi:hypothetical protein